MLLGSYRDRFNEELDNIVERLEQLLKDIDDHWSHDDLHDELCGILEDIG